MASNEVPPGVELAPEFDFKLYRYIPSLEASIVAIVVFAILTSVHFWRLLRARAFYFTPFLIGGVCAHLYLPTQYYHGLKLCSN